MLVLVFGRQVELHQRQLVPRRVRTGERLRLRCHDVARRRRRWRCLARGRAVAPDTDDDGDVRQRQLHRRRQLGRRRPRDDVHQIVDRQLDRIAPRRAHQPVRARVFEHHVVERHFERRLARRPAALDDHAAGARTRHRWRRRRMNRHAQDRRRLGLLGDLADAARQPPPVRANRLVARRQPVRAQIGAEGAQRILDLLLDERRRFAGDRQLLLFGRPVEAIALDGERVVPAPRLLRQPPHLAEQRRVRRRVRERAHHLVERARRILLPLLTHLRAPAQKVELLRRGAARDQLLVHVEQPLRVVGAHAQPLESRSQAVRIELERGTHHRERTLGDRASSAMAATLRRDSSPGMVA